MRRLKWLWALVLANICWSINAQTATMTGIVLNSKKLPVRNASIKAENLGTTTDSTGYYLLEVPADKPIDVHISHLGYRTATLNKLTLTSNELFVFNPVLTQHALQMSEVMVSANGQRQLNGITTVSTEVIQNIPGANAGVENILKLLPGVGSSNELSTQYTVRGGNYDENLIYINGIEVYRPFLVRSAQQEGLSLVNNEMVRQVLFSAGGFQAKYGDKLSSVLDIEYKNPVDFGTTIDLSFINSNITLETLSKNKKFGSISGLRYRNNSLLVNTKDTEANYRPLFFDFQTFETFRFSKKFKLDFLGYASINDYRNTPIRRQTDFGTLSSPRTLIVNYEGRENSKFQTLQGSLKANYQANDNTYLNLTTSLYHTIEEEYSDVIAYYQLSAFDGENNSFMPSRGIGGQFNRARNSLDALIFNLEHRGSTSDNQKKLAWGMKYTYEDIRDRIRESEFLDSLGYLVRPPNSEFTNNQPETPYEAPIEAYSLVEATNFTANHRFSGFLQYSENFQTSWGSWYYNAGMRAHYYKFTPKESGSVSDVVVSPRLQLAVKPEWRRDMFFRLSGGVYHQPPFYREYRNERGTINTNVEAQTAYHAVISNEYSFNLWNRPFHLNSEAYYKKLTNVNPYTLNDVRIRYVAENIAEAFAYGFDFRLYGAFVPGTESWVSLGYLRTNESWNDREYIARPSDQRFKLGLLFQDYIPQLPDFKMYLNLVYNSGLPGGSPNYVDPYDYQRRLRDYKRADLGISYIFAGGNKQLSEKHWANKFNELSLGLELYNLFDNVNSITNTWVRDVESKRQYAIPNFLTGRVLNLRLRMRFN